MVSRTAPSLPLYCTHPDQSPILSALSCDPALVPCSCPAPPVVLAPHRSQRGFPPLLQTLPGLPPHSESRPKSPLITAHRSHPHNFPDLSSRLSAPSSPPPALASWQLLLHTKVLPSGVCHQPFPRPRICCLRYPHGSLPLPLQASAQMSPNRDFSISLLRDSLQSAEFFILVPAMS